MNAHLNEAYLELLLDWQHATIHSSQKKRRSHLHNLTSFAIPDRVLHLKEVLKRVS